VVIVTGGAHGIGKEYCRAFAAAGCRVVVADLDAAAAREAAGAIGDSAIAVETDVADERRAVALASATVERFGAIDVLVNNAAVYATIPVRRVSIEALTVSEWDQVMAVNLRGMFLASRAVIPAMRAKGYGRIVNIASGTAFQGTGALHYATSKAGVLGFTRNLSRELGPHGITVNAVAPGATVTETTLDDVRRSHTETASTRAIPRVEVPSDIVGAVLFLASPAAGFITGQTLVVDGGRVFH
jgi:3-oxoacyl-[acyl-carrier protein] reductase